MFQTLWSYVSVAYKLMEVVTALGLGPALLSPSMGQSLLGSRELLRSYSRLGL